MNQIIRSLMSRKSVRSFTDQEIPEDMIQVILEASTQAPTAGNQQLYTILLYRRYHGEHRRAERYPWSASICVPCGNARLRISHRAAGSPQKAGAGRYEIHRPWKQLPCVICRRTEGHAFLSFWGGRIGQYFDHLLYQHDKKASVVSFDAHLNHSYVGNIINFMKNNPSRA